MIDYTADVLRNRGVPIELAVLDDAGEPTDSRETVYLRFTVNTIADLEGRFGSTAKWQESMAERVGATTRDTLAVCLGYVGEVGARQLGDRMTPQDLPAYGAAIGGAWAIANGVDPLGVVTLLNDAAALVAEARQAATT